MQDWRGSLATKDYRKKKKGKRVLLENPVIMLPYRGLYHVLWKRLIHSAANFTIDLDDKSLVRTQAHALEIRMFNSRDALSAEFFT